MNNIDNDNTNAQGHNDVQVGGATQEISETQELAESQEPCGGEGEQVWGRLFAVRGNQAVFNLIETSYTFGRGEADFRFTKHNLDSKYLPAISKIHFSVSRVFTGDLDPVVVIEDLSCNGTFVNKTIIGSGKKTILKNNDEISVASPKTKVFVFHDCLKNDDDDYPTEVTKKYTMSKKLGTGTFGEVRLAYKQGTLEKCAIKILKKKGSQIKLNNLQQIGNEIELLRSVNHPFIIKLEEVIDTPDHIYIVMEAAGGGELFDRLVSGGRLPEQTAKFYFYQLGLALQYIHDKNITHRDIKPENILLASDDEDTCIKLTDFGLSKLAADTSQMTTFCGTISYIAPELLEPSTVSYTKKVDLWSLGVVLYASLCCYAPFGGDDISVRDRIRTATYDFGRPVWKNVSEEAKDLISKLLVPEPAQRLGIEEMLQHPWLQDDDMKRKVENLLKQQASPSRKRSHEEININDKEMMVAKTPRVPAGITA